LSEVADVIVVGGGPGGSTTASFVAMKGYRVVLLERERFPRHQIGESLLPATVNGICVLLGVEDELKKANFTYKRGGTYKWGTHPQPWSFTFGPSTAIQGTSAFAYQVERSKFDAILLNNARRLGVEVREEHTVNGVIREGDRIAGVTYCNAGGNTGSIRARIVVDSSGNATPLSRTVSERVYSEFFKNVAVYCYFHGAKRLPEPNSGNILCEAFDQGWFWFIPLRPDLTSVGAVVGCEHAASLKEGSAAAMDQFIGRTVIVKDFLSTATRITEGPYGAYRVRKDYSYCNERFWRPGMALVGDAACFIDPIFSSGVHLATYSGLLVARSINSWLAGKLSEERSFREFELRYRREFGTFYQFLVAFYDMDKGLESYYWDARKILNSQEMTNEAFIQLVSGVSEPDEPMFHGAQNYLSETGKLGSALRAAYEGGESDRPKGGSAESERFLQQLRVGANELLTQAALGRRPRNVRPAIPGGLIPSTDGLSWVEYAKEAVGGPSAF
jgi:halogenation protein CepH